MASDPLIPSRSQRSRVRAYIEEHGLVRSGERLLVGVSGGPDSTALILLLASLRKPLDVELVAAHFDHRLRGRRAAARELKFLRQLTERLEIPLHTSSRDVRGWSLRTRESIEEAARELRYRFLADMASRTGCSTVTVGHTLDDQAETVLLHLVRGSGLRGLAGMTPVAPWPVAASGALRLVRPLLEITRDQTQELCDKAGLQPVDDPSNRSPHHLRSRIRHDLMPLLRNLNPRVDAALARLAATAAADIDILEELAAGALRPSTPKREVRIDRKRLAALPQGLQRHTVRVAFRRLLGDIRGLGERHITAVVAANDGGAGGRLSLARGARADVRRSSIVLTTSPSPAKPLPKRSAALAIPGITTYGQWTLQIEILRRRPKVLSQKDGLLAVLDADRCGPLRVRGRRDGDRFEPLGLLHEKKLQDYFVDAGVPKERRDELPLLASKRGIAWIATQRPAEWAKITPATKSYLRVTASS